MWTLHGHEEGSWEDRGSRTRRGGGGGTPEAPSGVAPSRALGRRRLRLEPLRQRKHGLPDAGFSHPPSPGAPLRRTCSSEIRVLQPPLDWRLPPSQAGPSPPRPRASPAPGPAPAHPAGWGPGALQQWRSVRLCSEVTFLVTLLPRPREGWGAEQGTPGRPRRFLRWAEETEPTWCGYSVASW